MDKILETTIRSLFKFLVHRSWKSSDGFAEAYPFIRPQMVLRIRLDRKWNGSGPPVLSNVHFDNFCIPFDYWNIQYFVPGQNYSVTMPHLQLIRIYPKSDYFRSTQVIQRNSLPFTKPGNPRKRNPWNDSSSSLVSEISTKLARAENSSQNK